MVLTISRNEFFLDNKPFRILSGAIHYFRVMPDKWEDRLLKLRACGLNTVETYIPWNLHQPKENEFNFLGVADVEKFIRLAEKLELKVIIRPSPYICAEWDFGGLPWWLLKDDNIQLRCSDSEYLKWVDKYYNELFKRLVPLQSTNGGPIIAMQIENEYGSYGNDKGYLEYLKKGMIKRGVDVLLFTSDGTLDSMLQGGTLPDVLKTVNFGSRAKENFDKLREYQPDKPLVCMEFWNGWFDHWGETHHTRDEKDVVKELKILLDMDASVNLYMFHGGTNFGYFSGANYEKGYQSTTTSYDDDALLNENGDITPKYLAVKKVLEDKFGSSSYSLPEDEIKVAYGIVKLEKSANLMDNLDKLAEKQRWSYPPTMEKANQGYGFIFYETKITGPRKTEPLIIQDVHDRGLVFINGKYLGTIQRDVKGDEINIEVPNEGVTLSILVENCGRINYGTKLKDPKGITKGVILGKQFIFGWDVYPIDLSKYNELDYTKDNDIFPIILKGYLEIDKIGDTFIILKGFKKGVVFVNGFNLGVYCDIGPQQTLYVPSSILKKGKNEIMVFEQYGFEKPQIEFIDYSILYKEEREL